MKISNKYVTLPNWAIVALLVATVLGMQLLIAVPKLELPFLDGMQHYNFDNSLFSTFARNGNLLNEPKTSLGITVLPYSSREKPSEGPNFYTHHPFLFKGLFQQFVRIFGDSEWVSRSFALGVATIASTGFFTVMSLATGSAVAAFLGSAVLVSIPVFAIFQSCIKYELDGMAAGMWFFVATAMYLRTPSRARLVTIAIFAAFAALAHWTGLLLVGTTFVWLSWEWWRFGDRNACRAMLAAGTGAVTGTALVIAAFVWLNGGWKAFLSDLLYAASARSSLADLPSGAWTERQLKYINSNFGQLLPWVAAFLAIGLAVRCGYLMIRKKTCETNGATNRLLPAFFFCTLATACIWQFAFRQGSYVHNYWQIWFCLPVAGLIVIVFSTARTNTRTLVVVASLTLGLIGWLQVTSYASYRVLLRAQMGAPQDIEFLKSLRRDNFARFVFLPLKEHPYNDWFQGPIFDYYTDRSIETFSENMAMPVREGDKVLMLKYTDQKLAILIASRDLKVEFVNEKCTKRFCAYDVVRSQTFALHGR